MGKRMWSEAVVPIIFTSYCLAYFLQVFGYPYESVIYPFILISIILLFLMVIMVIIIKHALTRIPHTSLDPSDKAVSGKVEKDTTSVQKLLTTWKKVYKAASVMIGTFLYSEIVSILGFTITTSIFLFILLWICGTRRISFLLPLSLGFAFFLFFLMNFYLKINLPSFTLVDLPLGL